MGAADRAVRARVRQVLERFGVENLTGGVVRDVTEALTCDLEQLVLADGRRGAKTRHQAVENALGYHRHYLGRAAMRHASLVHDLLAAGRL